MPSAGQNPPFLDTQVPLTFGGQGSFKVIVSLTTPQKIHSIINLFSSKKTKLGCVDPKPDDRFLGFSPPWPPFLVICQTSGFAYIGRCFLGLSLVFLARCLYWTPPWGRCFGLPPPLEGKGLIQTFPLAHNQKNPRPSGPPPVAYSA